MQYSQPRPPDTVLLNFLTSNDLFDQFSNSTLEEFLSGMEWMCLEPDSTLFRQGDAGGFLYVVY